MVTMEAGKAGWNPESLSGIANKLCMEAFRRGSMDNITGLSLSLALSLSLSLSLARARARARALSRSIIFRRGSIDNITGLVCVCSV